MPAECPACHASVTITRHGRLRHHAIGPYRSRWIPEGSLTEAAGGSDPCEGGGLRPPEARRLVETDAIRHRTQDQLERLHEIKSMAHVRNVTWDTLDHGLINVMIDEADAEELGVWIVLSVAPNGSVASYDINQPRQYPTFAKLVEDKAATTA